MAWSPDTSSQIAGTAPTSLRRSRIDKLGARLDGWADLIDDAGDQVDALAQVVRQRLAVREMPQVARQDGLLSPARLSTERRRYHLVAHRVGATIALYIGAFGRDLYVAWELFIRRVWNRAVLLGVLAFVTIVNTIRFFVVRGRVMFTRGGFRVIAWGFTDWLIPILLGYITLLVLIGFAGLILKRDFLAFLTLPINHFRADDIAAMTFAVHHSVVEGLDSIGVERSTIRPKERFQAGQRGRII